MGEMRGRDIHGVDSRGSIERREAVHRLGCSDRNLARLCLKQGAACLTRLLINSLTISNPTAVDLFSTAIIYLVQTVKGCLYIKIGFGFEEYRKRTRQRFILRAPTRRAIRLAQVYSLERLSGELADIVQELLNDLCWL